MLFLKGEEMFSSFIEIVILFCLKRIKDERSIFSILHLLNGKKSSQTIQDAHFFQLTNFFQTFVDLTRSDIESFMKKYEQLEWIKEVSEHHFLLTHFGEENLNEFLHKTPIPKYLNGWKYHNTTKEFWERFSLLVQVVSQLNKNHKKYIPVQRNLDVHLSIKKLLRETKQPKNNIAKLLHDEIMYCMQDAEIDPSFLILRLTGYNQIGWTEKQAAEILKVDIYYFHFNFLSILHFMLNKILSNKKDYPILSLLINNSAVEVPLTQSTRRTYELIEKGYSIEEIAEIRKLKKSTIEDHLVEITLNIANFNISLYVNEEKQEMIKKIARNLPSKQLKQIRDRVENATYFEIRLVLAKYGDI